MDLQIDKNGKSFECEEIRYEDEERSGYLR